MGKKVIIIGAVAGGASAAARLRRLDESLEIILIDRNQYISFANCGLPYYIGKTITDRSKLLVQTPENMHERFNIDVRILSEVISIDTHSQTVKIKKLDGGEYEESYDYLVISPGAKPMRPPIPGSDSRLIYTLRNIPDTDIIKKLTSRGDIKRAVIVGGGFIGVEMAENLIDDGIETYLVEAAPHIMAPFDTEVAILLENELIKHGVRVYNDNGVTSFEENGNEITVNLKSGASLKADFVLMAAGVIPDTSFLSGSGIEMNEKGYIRTDANMRTNIENVYAVGDAVLIKDFISGLPTSIPLAGPANKQGRIAADNICGIKSEYRGTQGTSIIKVFDLTAACTGSNARNLTKQGISFRTVFIHPNSHASYYPGAFPIILKLIFTDEGKILGAQACGMKGVDKRIDIIATVIRMGGTVNDLKELELAYAPPYSSAKDPVNMAGFAASNILDGLIDVFRYDELESYSNSDSILLDVRTAQEYELGAIPNSVNIPVDELRGRMNELDKTKLILIYCRVGIRGYIASRILSQHGYTVKNLTGGYEMAKIKLVRPATSASAKKSDTLFLPQEGGSLNKGPLKVLDACGLSCPGPLLKVKKVIDEIAEGEFLEIRATDPGFTEDIKAWTSRTGNNYIEAHKEETCFVVTIQKGKSTKNESNTNLPQKCPDDKTIIVFSGDFDKAMASFIIANGAASMGKKVTMFFTFWGLNILRKPDGAKVKKNFMDNMFGMMMPRGARKLTLSKMNMLGVGTKMMRGIMKNKKVSSLEELIKFAIESGIEIVACQMTMDVMGLRKEELIDGVKVAGVGYYLDKSEDSNLNLFI